MLRGKVLGGGWEMLATFAIVLAVRDSRNYGTRDSLIHVQTTVLILVLVVAVDIRKS